MVDDVGEGAVHVRRHACAGPRRREAPDGTGRQARRQRGLAGDTQRANAALPDLPGGVREVSKAFIALLVAGQMVASVLIDHVGWLGVGQRSVDLPRLLGVLLLVNGLMLIRR